jgi:hypothetical protein
MDILLGLSPTYQECPSEWVNTNLVLQYWQARAQGQRRLLRGGRGALASASDDYVHAAQNELSAGNPEAAWRMTGEGASLAEEAARCCDTFAEAKDGA